MSGNGTIYESVNMEKMPPINEYPDNPETFGQGLKLLRDGKQLAICHMGFRFDSYAGWCGHFCSYCFARGISMRFKRWEIEDIKIADIDQTKKYFTKAKHADKNNSNTTIRCIQHRYPIRVGTNTDCFQPCEKKYRITYRFIDEIMNKYNYPYSICTKSAIVIDPEYMDLYGDNVTFQFTLSTLDQGYLDRIERGAPTAMERINAMRVLSGNGYFVGCRISPHIPEYMDDIEALVGRIADAGCKHVISELLRISPILNGVMIAECGFDVAEYYRGLGAKLNTGYWRYPLIAKIAYQKKLAALCESHGMTFATCADEDPSFHTVKNCCGYDNVVGFEGCPFATYDTAFELCKEHGEVSFTDLLGGGWCPDNDALEEVWNSGYFENILMNLQFDESVKKYVFVDCNKKMANVNTIKKEKQLGLF